MIHLLQNTNNKHIVNISKVLTVIYFLSILIFLLPLTIFAQVKNIGTPYVKNFEQSLTSAGQQTWNINISENGLTYFANNNGVLEFDGEHWHTFQLPNKSVVRSVLAGQDKRIYAGGFNEIGFFKANEIGKLIFYSIIELIPEHEREFGEVWKIFELGNKIIFQSYRQLMILDSGEMTVIQAPVQFHLSFKVKDQLYIIDIKEGIFSLDQGKLYPLSGTGELKSKLIWAILPKGNNLLIATADEGIFEYNGSIVEAWDTPAARYLIENQIYCGQQINPQQYAFGTIQNGLLISDINGEIVQIVNREKGLQDNTILSLSTDLYGNLWLGLDNGIDYVEINSSLSYISYFDAISAGYSSILYKGYLYLGTNRGLFYKKWDSIQNGNNQEHYELVRNTQGQVWSLQIIDGQLICGHNLGTFSIKNNIGKLISEEQGGWTYLKPGGVDSLLIGGTYSGLQLFAKRNNQWVFKCKVSGFDESSRLIVNGSNGELWMSHGYKGVYRLRFSPSYEAFEKITFYNSEHGFSNDFGINVFELNGRPVFTAFDGFYEYDIQTDLFVKSDKLNDFFENMIIRFLKEDSVGNIWYFTENDAGVLRAQEDGQFVNIELPFKPLHDQFISGFQSVYPLDGKNVFIGTKEGFVHYKPDYIKNYKQDFNAYICELGLIKFDSILIHGDYHERSSKTINLPFFCNDIRITYSSSDMPSHHKTYYSTYLEGYDEDWSAWEQRISSDFTNLRFGDYIFKVKARNIYNKESSEKDIYFEIMPPIYSTWAAYIVYSIIVVLIVIYIVYLSRKRIEKKRILIENEQNQIFREKEKQLQNTSLQNEKEVIKLRNENLKAQMILKDKELANATMIMIQKNKTLIKLKTELSELTKKAQNDHVLNHLHFLIKKINRDIDNELNWNVFETHFENVHEEFLKKLKAQYQDLSPRELKLCAYLKLNISSKEIATLMNISTRGVEISRYRLRKKLNIGRETNLTEFIMSI